MISDIIKYLIFFIGLVLLQALILNNIQFSGYVNPYLYILFIIFLPFEVPKWLLLSSAFFLGLTIDAFSDTMGMHTSASVFLAFSRYFVLKFMATREGYDFGLKPTLRDMGIAWYFPYVLVLTLLHHFFLFYVEIFSFEAFFSTFLRVILSSVFILILIGISQLFNYSDSK